MVLEPPIVCFTFTFIALCSRPPMLNVTPLHLVPSRPCLSLYHHCHSFSYLSVCQSLAIYHKRLWLNADQITHRAMVMLWLLWLRHAFPFVSVPLLSPSLPSAFLPRLSRPLPSTPRRSPSLVNNNGKRHQGGGNNALIRLFLGQTQLGTFIWYTHVVLNIGKLALW